MKQIKNRVFYRAKGWWRHRIAEHLQKTPKRRDSQIEGLPHHKLEQFQKAGLPYLMQPIVEFGVFLVCD